MPKVLVFGGTGALGSEIVRHFRSNDWEVTIASRTGKDGNVDMSNPNWADQLTSKLDAVVWAQGANFAGSLMEISLEDVRVAFEANVMFILDTLKQLNNAEALEHPSRGVILSSVWQEFARENKLAYLVSKSSLSGLIPSLAMDLASDKFAINAVLPGVIDTPMTRNQLSSEQIQRVESGTPGGTLATPQHVANAVAFLASSSSAGINGQSIIVDRGWSVKREI